MPAQEVLQLLGTHSEAGLSEDEARARFERYGANLLTPPQTRSTLLRYLLQFNQALVYILLAAAGITALLGEWLDSGVIFGVVIVNALMGFLQEFKALHAIEALARSMTTEATLIRQGRKRLVNASELVPGDVVLLQAGDRVPADIRLVHVKGLQVDESALTGEPVPVSKQTQPLAAGAGPGDRVNMAYSSALVRWRSE